MSVVLTLGGLNYGRTDRMGAILGGYASTEGRQRVNVEYPQAASARSITVGANKLDTAIRYWLDRGEQVEVLAHSQGAEACSEWLADHGDDATVPPARVSFILTGNPRRRLGGAGRIGWDWKRLPRTPETRYTVRDVARRWDGWCNSDNWPDRHSLFSRGRLFWGRFVDHLHYENVNLEECQVREVSGNTTYLVAD